MNARIFTVTAWTNGSSTYGLRVRKTDRSSFFEPSWTSVTLKLLGGIRPMTVRTDLTRSFWRKCPELRGRVIRDWLFENALAPWERGSPPKFRAAPTAEGEFSVALIE